MSEIPKCWAERAYIIGNYFKRNRSYEDANHFYHIAEEGVISMEPQRDKMACLAAVAEMYLEAYHFVLEQHHQKLTQGKPTGQMICLLGIVEDTLIRLCNCDTSDRASKLLSENVTTTRRNLFFWSFDCKKLEIYLSPKKLDDIYEKLSNLYCWVTKVCATLKKCTTYLHKQPPKPKKRNRNAADSDSLDLCCALKRFGFKLTNQHKNKEVCSHNWVLNGMQIRCKFKSTEDGCTTYEVTAGLVDEKGNEFAKIEDLVSICIGWTIVPAYIANKDGHFHSWSIKYKNDKAKEAVMKKSHLRLPSK
jgi:hypothetical protein